MNPEELLNVARVAMQRVKDRDSGHYSLYLQKGELLCCGTSLVPGDCAKIITITKQQLVVGMTPDEWDELRDRLWKIYKEIAL